MLRANPQIARTILEKRRYRPLAGSSAIRPGLTHEMPIFHSPQPLIQDSEPNRSSAVLQDRPHRVFISSTTVHNVICEAFKICSLQLNQTLARPKPDLIRSPSSSRKDLHLIPDSA